MPTALINGTDLYYEVHGDGEPILFHHGYQGTHHAWDRVVPAFSDRYRCVVMDARGACHSGHPEGGYTIAQFADDAIAMADHLGLDRFTYVGHSMGGVIGYELGLRYQHRLNRLIVVAPAPADGIDIPGIETLRAAQRRLRDARDLGAMLEESVALAGRPDPEYLLFSIERGLACSEGHYEGAWQSLVEYRQGNRLGEITVPTLMMAGAADALLFANLRDFERLGNATLHVFSRVGHGMEYEAPEEFNPVLADFLEHGVVTARTLREALAARAAAAAPA